MNPQAVTSTRPTLDVSRLPPAVMDHRSPIWWGNILLLCIETTMFALMVAAYFYVRGNFSQWPPPQTNWAVARYDTAPALGVSTINLVVILLSCAPMLWADRMGLRLDRRAVTAGLGLCILLGLVAIGLRFREFSGLNFRWDDNAYGSVVWTLLGLHLLHLIVGTLENVTMFAWVAMKGLDQKHARDVRVGATYWYWIGGIWLLLFLLIYISPRLQSTS